MKDVRGQNQNTNQLEENKVSFRNIVWIMLEEDLVDKDIFNGKARLFQKLIL